MKTSKTDYDEYTDFCLTCSKSDQLFKDFKNNPTYTEVLEHVTPIQGFQYLDAIMNCYEEYLPLIHKVKVNDQIGNPRKIQTRFGFISPTTLRYFKTACEMAHCFPGIENYHILEIGGGYGGQAVVSSIVHGFETWTIIDLPEVANLQTKYLYLLGFSPNIFCYSYPNTLHGKNDLVVSNYAFSECVEPIQREYIRKYMSDDEKIYMMWNKCENSLSRDTIKELLGVALFSEIPLTGPDNCMMLRGHANAPKQ